MVYLAIIATPNQVKAMQFKVQVWAISPHRKWLHATVLRTSPASQYEQLHTTATKKKSQSPLVSGLTSDEFTHKIY